MTARKGAAWRGALAAYGAAALAFASAVTTLYWTLGGDRLLSTVGGQFVRLAARGGPLVIGGGLAIVGVKLGGGLLALALVRPWGQRLPRRVLTRTAQIAGALLAFYGGLLVAVGALVLSGVIQPSGAVDRTALRWHVAVWDLWFLLWGLLLWAAGRWTKARQGRTY